MRIQTKVIEYKGQPTMLIPKGMLDAVGLSFGDELEYKVVPRGLSFEIQISKKKPAKK